MRPRTVSSMLSASRARVACQWNAKPRISTTKPVVADSVTVKAVSEQPGASASRRPCSTASSPSVKVRTLANACRRRQEGFPERPPRLRRWSKVERPEHVDEPASDDAGFKRYGGDANAFRTVNGGVTDGGDDNAVSIGDQHLSPGCPRPSWNEPLKLALKTPIDAGSVLLRALDAVEPVRQEIGRADLIDDIGDSLAPVIEHLHDGADANREQEGNDQGRHSTSQGRLGREQPQIGRFCDGLR